MLNWITKFYQMNLYTSDDVKEFVKSGDITEADFKTITGQDYAA
ncbi:XkdX family protein [Sporolactobacillus shoreicorticis]|uniref:XkdX family protein n=1 Tax=Sporolactobacillus shoreicorticis TaxID=1923877 RepID=A0ABW5RZD2_9BACL|nr:XkdX family protein [Sporolactobacillus shoreicorticis]MCO7125125.1 XkdX family protein [Sporolactobacillus shoreicorticis]